MNNNNLCKLSTDIGTFLNIPMWFSLSPEEQKLITDDKKHPKNNYYFYIIVNNYKHLNLLSILQYNAHLGFFTRGAKAIYTLNLKTLRPTNKSKIQKLLNAKIISKIKKLWDVDEKNMFVRK